MTTKDLLDYLDHVVKLETMNYELQRSYEKVTGLIGYFNNKRYSEKKTVDRSSSFGDNVLVGIIVVGAALGFIISFMSAYKTTEDGFFLFRLLSTPVNGLMKGTIIGAIVGGICAIILSFFNNEELRKKNEAIKKENIQIEKNNEMMKAADRRKVQLLKQEADSLKKQREETVRVLKQVYNLNIIYPKYRTFIAVCSLYEYIESGRCSALEGHEGGYNIYENELRLNLINEKLDIVIDKLEQIQRNQNYLYTTLKKSNENIDRLYKQVSNITANLNDISQNAYISAYNTDISARNTEYLKWVTYFNL